LQKTCQAIYAGLTIKHETLIANVSAGRRQPAPTNSGTSGSELELIVEQERGGNGESLGQLGGASLSNCRELRAEGGQREAWLQSLKRPASHQTGIVSQGTNANEALRGVDFPASHNRAVERGGMRRGVHRAGRRYSDQRVRP
jgi:hypothetical protein